MDLIEFLAQTEAPWSAALLGTVLGGLITWAVTAANDRRKIKNESKNSRVREIKELASVMLTVGRDIDRLVTDQQSQIFKRTVSEFILENTKLTARVEEAWQNFEFIAEKKIYDAGRAFFSSCIILLLPPIDDEIIARARGDLSRARLVFLNELRTMSGVPTLDRTPPTDPLTPSKHKEVHKDYMNASAEFFMGNSKASSKNEDS